MSVLVDALTAAQTRAVAALAKQYVGGQLDSDSVRIALDGIGLSDPTDTERWIAALDIIRETGAQTPAESKPKNGGDDAASDAQWTYLRDLCDKKGTVAPEGPLTKAQASEIIEQVKAGTYKPDDWSVPF